MFKIKNNFFEKNKFNEMKSIITHSNFNWYLQSNVVSHFKTTDKNIYFALWHVVVVDLGARGACRGAPVNSCESISEAPDF